LLIFFRGGVIDLLPKLHPLYENATECPPVGGELHCFKRLKFVQKYEKFAQKLSTPAEQDEAILFHIYEIFQYFWLIKKDRSRFGMDIALIISLTKQ
jgi:hypothetical protein